MDLYNLVWTDKLSFASKLDILTEYDLDLSTKITNRKPLTFDIYYDFSKNIDKIKSDNQKWKQIRLALNVLRIIRKWDRKYKIELKKCDSGMFFINFFKDTIDVSKNVLCKLGINFYVNDKYTYKTFVLWAHSLLKKGYITELIYNEFMSCLERKSSNGK